MTNNSSTCLLIVDVQKGFINNFTSHIPALVQRLQYDYDHVFVTRFYNDNPSMFRSLMNWHEFGKDSVDFPLAFAPKSTASIIDKTVYTCVTKDFLMKLRVRNITCVDICGINTDVCVIKCAVDLFESGIKSNVLKDYCGSEAGSRMHKLGLTILKGYIGDNQVK